MWQALVWNVEFLRGIIFFALGIVAALFLIPHILKRLQAERDKRLAKALLKEWGLDCIGAMMYLKPIGTPMIEIEEYGHSIKPDHFDPDLPIFLFWQDIQEGKRGPEGAADVIYEVFQKVLYSDEERAMKKAPPDKTYPFDIRHLTFPRVTIRRILNPMYAKLEIFELELLPNNELEMAMGYLDTFAQSGYINRYTLISYALHLAQSMEKFAKYLWRLEGWSKNSKLKKR